MAQEKVESWREKLEKALQKKNPFTDVLSTVEDKTKVKRLYLVSGAFSLRNSHILQTKHSWNFQRFLQRQFHNLAWNYRKRSSLCWSPLNKIGLAYDFYVFTRSCCDHGVVADDWIWSAIPGKFYWISLSCLCIVR